MRALFSFWGPARRRSDLEGGPHARSAPSWRLLQRRSGTWLVDAAAGVVSGLIGELAGEVECLGRGFLVDVVEGVTEASQSIMNARRVCGAG